MAGLFSKKKKENSQNQAQAQNQTQVQNQQPQPPANAYPWSTSQLPKSGQSFLPRSFHASCAVSQGSNEVFIFGGYVKNELKKDLFVYDALSNFTQPISTSGDVPSPRAQHTAVTIGNYLVIFGGETKKNQSGLDDNIYLMNKGTREWTRITCHGSVPVGRFGHSATSIGPAMFVFGGISDGYYLNDLVSFDLRTLNSPFPKWDFHVASNAGPSGRMGHVACAFQDKLYIFGGTDGKVTFNDLWCYDFSQSTWHQIAAIGYIPSPRSGACAAMVGDVMYVFGGRNQEGKELADLCAFKFRNRRWYRFTNMGPAPTSRVGHSIALLNEKILILGGEFASQPKTDDQQIIYILDTMKIKYPADSRPTTPTAHMQQSPPRSSTPRVDAQMNGPSSNVRYTMNPELDRAQIARQSAYSTQGPPQRSPTMPQFSTDQNADGIDRRRPVKHQSMVADVLQRSRPQSPYEGKPPTPVSPTTFDQEVYRRMPRSGSPLAHGNPDAPGNNQGRGTSYYGDARPQVQNQRLGNFGQPPPRPSRDGIDISDLIGASKGRSDGTTSPSPKYPLNTTPSSPTYPTPSSTPTGADSFYTITQDPNATRLPLMQSPEPMSNIEQTSFSSNRSYSEEVDVTNPQTTQVIRPLIPSDPNSSVPSDNLQQNSQDSTIPSPTSNVEEQSTGTLQSRQKEGRERELLREIQQRDQIISEMKKKEQWWRTEIALARKIRAINPNDDDEDRRYSFLNGESLPDVGDKESDRFRIFDSLVKVKTELKRAKASIATQAQSASKKIAEAEKMRSIALQEAAYYKSRLKALKSRDTTSMEELAQLESSRAQELEEKLIICLRENEGLNARIDSLNKALKHEQFARQVTEERAREASERAEEAHKSHSRGLDELATTHSRVATAESKVRELTAQLAELVADSSKYQSENSNLQEELNLLQQRLEQYPSTIEKANAALRAAIGRAEEAESLWTSARKELESLESEAANLRSELSSTRHELESTKCELNRTQRNAERAGEHSAEMERLWKRAKEEVEALREMMPVNGVEGLIIGKSQNRSPSTEDVGQDSESINIKQQTARISELEEKLNMLLAMQRESQQTIDQVSSQLSEANMKNSRLEHASIKAKAESASLLEKLADMANELSRMKTILAEKETALIDKTREMEEVQIYVGMMREAMIQKGFRLDTINPEMVKSGTEVLSLRVKELEAQITEMEQNQQEVAEKHENALCDLRKSLEESQQSRDEYKVRAEAVMNRLLALEKHAEELAHAARDTPVLEAQLRAAEERATQAEQDLADASRTFEDKMQQLESDYQTAVHYVKGTESMLRRLKAELQEKQEKIDELSGETIRLQPRKNDENSSDIPAGWYEEKAELEKRIRDLQTRLNEININENMAAGPLQEQFKRLQEDKSVLETENENLRARHTDLSRKASNRIKALEEEVVQLRQAKDKVILNPQSSHREFGDNSPEKNDQLVLERYEQAIRQLEQEKRELQERYRDSENKISLLLDQLDHQHQVASPHVSSTDLMSSINHFSANRESHQDDPRAVDVLQNEIEILQSQWQHGENQRYF
ncbi:uncharacterized protein VTP21DRAFT_7161 [Calcarisporiella thermophila]|uniref:uncharacterized protein n=1 Tax=Calcarisporiella thermophila TaxID=911321 RepID=UPI003742AC11